MIAGDFNARTSSLMDYVVHDDVIEYVLLPEGYITDILSLRLSKDKSTNLYGTYVLT